MKHWKWWMLCCMLMISLSLVACRSAAEPEDSGEVVDSSMFSEEGEDNEMRVDYAFSCGLADPEHPIRMDETHLYYDLKFTNEAQPADFGVCICMDGYPQQSSVGEETALFHTVSLNEAEKKVVTFALLKEDLVLLPGENHIVYHIKVLEPNFMPEHENQIAHQGKLSSAKYEKFQWESQGEPLAEPESLDVLTEDFKNMFGLGDQIENQVMLPVFVDRMIPVKDLEEPFPIHVLGDEYGTNRLFLFVNDEAQPVNGQEELVFSITKGMKSTITVNLKDQVKAGDKFYFVLLPVDDENPYAWPVKTDTYYVEE